MIAFLALALLPLAAQEKGPQKIFGVKAEGITKDIYVSFHTQRMVSHFEQQMCRCIP